MPTHYTHLRRASQALLDALWREHPRIVAGLIRDTKKESNA